jgi:3-methylcrotonyl-CoA carboxylase alpha subunit
MAKKTTEIKKVFIANRGEIALRVINSCRVMGIETVTVYTEIEKDYPHAFKSDQSFNLGDGALSETYLNQDLLVKLIKESGADAVHPGYGFLSENSVFRERLEKEGILFIGPSSASMNLMGSKIESKVAMEKACIPLITGYHGENQDAQLLLSKAKEIGFPILIKASAGGGGKGMRIVEYEKDFNQSLKSAKREALNAFSDDKVLIEKYILNPRHIEVQVMGDQHDQYFHFYERECSIQRRYQKIIEETPSPALSDNLRLEICETAVKIAESISYEGAGTVEFILGEDGNYFFLEMNTRLQVEHPITEMVTGVDLVELQILVAQGEKLNFKQDEISQRGHSIECRIYAENPDKDFMPSIGKIESVGFCDMPGVRLDSGFIDGNDVSVNFDPMLAKVIVYATNRQSATAKMVKALEEYTFSGLQTNIDYLKRILKSKPFIEGNTLTSFIKTFEKDLSPKELSDEDLALIIGASLFSQPKVNRAVQLEKSVTAWDRLQAFRN